ncbi:proteasome endopeptidase complex beta subunit [Cylindrobasidium torrendii FP15055 ss-10]|uniref:Proteasome subunit beta n=1 Tax=Cylindrobasidium torrendii FP15055 ss-10 TaxID=1314674 RepID=A0A0D7BD90_9AGAR|nr:proteasome endopeptidase complex beta subunit [Cylindrobasidium torrendii FP15055 ss-10]
MDHHPMNWGRPRNDMADPYGTYPIPQRPMNTQTFEDSVQHTQQPIVTGASVLAIKYANGVMLAADNLASYGSLARFKDVKRVIQVGSSTIVGASGDMSDFQYLQRELDELVIDEITHSDGHNLGAKEIHEYLSNLLYARRSKINPLWNSLLVGGCSPEGKRFLAYVDLLGTTYSASTLATGYGAYIAQPLLRKAVEGREDTLTEAEAVKILEDSLKVLYYRDARSLNKYQIAKVTAQGVEISDSKSQDTTWGFAEGIRGYGAQTQ